MPRQQFSPKIPIKGTRVPFKKFPWMKKSPGVLDASRLAQGFLRSCLAISTSAQEFGKVQPFLGDVGVAVEHGGNVEPPGKSTPHLPRKRGEGSIQDQGLCCVLKVGDILVPNTLFTQLDPLQKVYQTL